MPGGHRRVADATSGMTTETKQGNRSRDERDGGRLLTDIEAAYQLGITPELVYARAFPQPHRRRARRNPLLKPPAILLRQGDCRRHAHRTISRLPTPVQCNPSAVYQFDFSCRLAYFVPLAGPGFLGAGA